MKNPAETGRDEQSDPTEPKEKIIAYTDEYKDKVVKFIKTLKAEEILSSSVKFEKPQAELWLDIDDNGDVVGTVSLEGVGNNIGYIMGMYVKKELRGTGHGTKLLDKSIEFAKQNKYKKLFLAVLPERDRTQKFYANNGFQIVENPPPSNKTFHEGTVFFQMDLEDKN